MSDKEQAVAAFWHLASWVLGNPGEAAMSLLGVWLLWRIVRRMW